MLLCSALIRHVVLCLHFKANAGISCGKTHRHYWQAPSCHRTVHEHAFCVFSPFINIYSEPLILYPSNWVYISPHWWKVFMRWVLTFLGISYIHSKLRLMFGVAINLIRTLYIFQETLFTRAKQKTSSRFPILRPNENKKKQGNQRKSIWFEWNYFYFAPNKSVLVQINVILWWFIPTKCV